MNLVLLNEIKLGYSKSSSFFIKHPGIADEAYSEELNTKYLELAIRRKIPRESEAIILAQKAKTWTVENERTLQSSSAYLIRLQESYDKIIESQKKYLEEDLIEISIKVRDLKFKKSLALGKTAEIWADKMSNERYILSLFYKDSNLNQRAFSEEDIEHLEQKDVDNCFTMFYDYRSRFIEPELKSLACSGFCQNLFSVAGNCFLLFVKNALDLTCFQQRFIMMLENYKNIISGVIGKISDDKLSNWEELDKWAKSDAQGREEMENSWGNHGQSNDKISFANIQKASMVKGEGSEMKVALELLS